jgi:hypothetical protein
VEELRTSLADQAASLAMTEEWLRQEQVARQRAEAQLQQEQTTLVEARAVLEPRALGDPYSRSVGRMASAP